MKMAPSTPPRGTTRSRPRRPPRGAPRSAPRSARSQPASPRAQPARPRPRPAPAPAHRARCAATDVPAARAAVAQEHADARSRDLRGRRARGPRAAPLAAVGVDAPPRAAFPALAPPRNLLFGRRQRVAGPSPPRSPRHCPRAARALASRGQDCVAAVLLRGAALTRAGAGRRAGRRHAGAVRQLLCELPAALVPVARRYLRSKSGKVLPGRRRDDARPRLGARAPVRRSPGQRACRAARGRSGRLSHAWQRK